MVNQTVFNQVTGNKRTISAEIEVAYVQRDDIQTPAFYIKVTVGGQNKLGAAMGPYYLNNLSTLPDGGGTQQFPAGSGSAFGSLTAQFANYTRLILEGDTEQQALNF